MHRCTRERQLAEARDGTRIDAFVANSRTSVTRMLQHAREDPRVLVDASGKELRSFQVSIDRPLGTKRGVGRGGTIDSVREAVDLFYVEVVQNIRQWSGKPPQMPE